jgi:cysteine-S-conjugate beta-lyase
VLDPAISKAAVDAMFNGFELFRMGASFGGFESLAVTLNPTRQRTATRWTDGRVLRFHVGLEDPEDLIADLEAGVARLKG